MKLTLEQIEKMVQETMEQEQEQMSALKKVISQGNLPERYAVSIGRYNNGYSLVLYQLPPLKTEVAGFCQISKTKKPCIPETYEVGAMARKAGRDYKGLGALMYDLAATLVKIKHDGGITSDHTSSTTEAAYKVWDKMLNSGNYIKRGTAISRGKHDEFDYDNSTPSDPADDCDVPKGSDVAASDHSLQIKQESPYLEKFLDNHVKALDVAAKAAKALGKPFDAAEIESALEDEGFALFAERYDGTIPVLKKEYFSIWNTIKRAVGMKE